MSAINDTLFRPSAICPTPDDRERFLDMSRRMIRTQNVLFVSMLLLLVPGVVATYKPLAAAVGLVTVAVQAVLSRLATRFPRPELTFAASMVIALAGMTAAIVLAGREHSGDLAILIWPAVTVYTRVPKRIAHAFTALTAGLMVTVQLAFDPHAVAAHPLAPCAILVALLSTGLIAAAVRESDIRHRRESILDELTGLLNRNALGTRIAELRAQSRLADGGIGLILADLDHFKAVNDRHGHGRGDAVLRAVSERMGGCLRAYDSLYRIGGEELAVLVPGAGQDELAELAERLRAAVASEPLAGLEVTISIGAARSRPDAELAWSELFHAADRALYRAKASGRDRVEIEP